MTQHTPGPWVTDNGHAERDGIQVWDTVHGWIIADVVNDQHDNAEANAALIAAAPDMLEALRAAHKHAHKALTAESNSYTDEENMLDVLAAAIAAAEGPGDTQS